MPLLNHQDKDTLFEILSPKHERMEDHPKFLDSILVLLSKSEDDLLDASKIFKKTHSKLNGTILIATKDFHNLPRYDHSVYRDNGHPGQYGTTVQDKGDNYGEISIIPLCKHNSSSITDEDLHKYSIFNNARILSPFDWTIQDDCLYLASEKGIYSVPKDSKPESFLSSPWLSWPHSITPLGDNKLAIASTGADMLLFFDTKEKKVYKKISAWDVGIQTSLGIKEPSGHPVKRINVFEDLSLDKYHSTLRDRFGFEVHTYRRDTSFSDSGIPTRHQSAHFNSITSHPLGYFLASAFATSKFDINTGNRIKQLGTGGSIFAFKSGHFHPVITGLTNPHHVLWIGEKDRSNYFMVTNTGLGTVNIYKESKEELLQWSLVGTIDFNSFKEEQFRDTPWIQQVIPTVGQNGQFYLTACDNSRRGIYILNVNSHDYHFIKTSNNAVTHRVSYIDRK